MERNSIVNNPEGCLKKISVENGVALAISLMILLVLSLIGSAALMTATIEVDMAGNQKHAQIAFYAADSGWQLAAQWLDNQYPGCTQNATTTDIASDTFGAADDVIAVSADQNINYSLNITYNGASIAPGYGTKFKRFMYTIESIGNGYRNSRSKIEVTGGKIFYVGGY